MLVAVTSSFNKDISKLQDKRLLLAIRDALQLIETSPSLNDIPHLKKLAGTSSYFRLVITEWAYLLKTIL